LVASLSAAPAVSPSFRPSGRRRGDGPAGPRAAAAASLALHAALALGALLISKGASPPFPGEQEAPLVAVAAKLAFAPGAKAPVLPQPGEASASPAPPEATAATQPPREVLAKDVRTAAASAPPELLAAVEPAQATSPGEAVAAPAPAATVVARAPPPVAHPPRRPASLGKPPDAEPITQGASTAASEAAAAPERRDGLAEGAGASAQPDTVPAAAAGGGDPSYEAALLAWLERHKVYPYRARLRGIEGEVRLRLVIAGDGRLDAATIVGHSGQGALDRAALDLASRAEPYPPPPGAARRIFDVPIVFALARR